MLRNIQHNSISINRFGIDFYETMIKEKGFCEVCGTEIEVNMCCSGYMCGCYGLPTEPPVCSNECYDIFMSKDYRDKVKQERENAFIKLHNNE